jgi:hypothetical protein
MRIHIVAVDSDDQYVSRQVVAADSGEFLPDVFDERAMVAEEHDQIGIGAGSEFVLPAVGIR